jgi:uncharacterized protein
MEPQLGTGIGWRPEIADAVERMPGVDWVEVVAENLCPDHVPGSLLRLRERGVTVIPHGVSLGLGGADEPDPGRLEALARRAEALRAPLVTEHIAFVRSGGRLTACDSLEAGHLLPVPRTRDALDVLCANIRIAQDGLPVPLAVENIAALFSWPEDELTEGQFLSELVGRTGVRLLIDVANLWTNQVNRGEDPAEALSRLPLEAIAYVHVAGGFERDGVWHDSHAHPVPRPVLDILTDLATRVSPPGVMLERDDNFPEEGELARELEAIGEAVAQGSAARGTPPCGAPADARTAQASAPRPDSGSGSGPHSGSDSASPPPSTSNSTSTSSPSSNSDSPSPSAPAPAPAPARQRLALAEHALLSSLVAGTPVPEGFDRERLRVQARSLAAKRADVVAKVAPELPAILGDLYRPLFLAYAVGRPFADGYRWDALHFAEHLLRTRQSLEAPVRRRLRTWWRDRTGPAPRAGALRRLAARGGIRRFATAGTARAHAL